MKTVIKNALLLDDAHNYESLDVLVDGETIEEIGRGLRADRELDLSGCTLLPGFIDSHVHVAVDSDGFRDDALRAWAFNGVTTVRELGMLSARPLADFMAFLRANDDAQHARVIRAGKYIDVDGGYGCGPNPLEKVGIIIDTPEQAAEAVSMQHRLGSECIKIGIMDTQGPPGAAPGPRPRLTTAMVRAICERAHTHKMLVAAHLKKAQTLKTLIACGLDVAAHTPVDPIDDETLAEAARRGVMFVTTIGNPERKPPAFVTPERLPAFLQRERENREGTIENLRRLHEAGCVIAVGTDLIRSDDFRRDASIAVHELTQLRQAGLDTREILRCATLNGAKICGIERQEGSIRVGRRANLLAIRGRLDDAFQALKAPCFVMNRGTVIREEL